MPFLRTTRWALCQMTMATLTTDAIVRTTILVLFISIPDGLCLAVWSNFEIGDLDFWRGEAYMKFFEHLDKKGGFYYEVQLSS